MSEINPRADEDRSCGHRETQIPENRQNRDAKPATCRVSSKNDL